MNLKRTALLGILAMGLLTACQEKNQSHDQHAETEITLTNSGLEQAWSLINLNQGEPWQVNDEMKPHLMKGEELVNDFIKSGNTDYKKLGEAVTDQNNNLIKSCTMKGESHDELHNWLHPHLEITKALVNEDNPDKAKEIVGQLQKSYSQYHQYFN